MARYKYDRQWPGFPSALARAKKLVALRRSTAFFSSPNNPNAYDKLIQDAWIAAVNRSSDGSAFRGSANGDYIFFYAPNDREHPVGFAHVEPVAAEAKAKEEQFSEPHQPVRLPKGPSKQPPSGISVPVAIGRGGLLSAVVVADGETWGGFPAGATNATVSSSGGFPSQGSNAIVMVTFGIPASGNVVLASSSAGVAGASNFGVAVTAAGVPGGSYDALAIGNNGGIPAGTYSAVASGAGTVMAQPASIAIASGSASPFASAGSNVLADGYGATSPGGMYDAVANGYGHAALGNTSVPIATGAGSLPGSNLVALGRTSGWVYLELAPGTNIFPDPGFESGTVNEWTVTHTTVRAVNSSVIQPHGGSYSGLWQGTLASAYIDITVQPNTQYELIFWSKVAYSFQFLEFNLGIGVNDPEWYCLDSTVRNPSQLIYTRDNGTGGVTVYVEYQYGPGGSGDWGRYQYRWTTTNHTNLRISFTQYYGYGAGNVYLDDFDLHTLT